MIRSARWFYFGWFALISAAIVLQLYLAGYGVFAFNGLSGFGAHFVVGDLIGIAILLGVGLAFAARVTWRMTAVNGVLLVLMVIQVLLAHTGVPALSALHVVNGVVILIGAVYLTRESYTFARLESQSPTAQAAGRT